MQTSKSYEGQNSVYVSEHLITIQNVNDYHKGSTSHYMSLFGLLFDPVTIRFIIKSKK